MANEMIAVAVTACLTAREVHVGNMCPCKHLDFDKSKYGPDIELVEIGGFRCRVLHWRRGKTWTDNGPNQKPNSQNVQFCGQGRGRVNEIFACYNPGEMPCYEPGDPDIPHVPKQEEPNGR